MFSIFSNKFCGYFFLKKWWRNWSWNRIQLQQIIYKKTEASVQAACGAGDRKHLEAQKNCGAVVEWFCQLSTMSHSLQPEEDSLPCTISYVNKGGPPHPDQMPSLNSSAKFSRQVLTNTLTQSSSGFSWEFWGWMVEYLAYPQLARIVKNHISLE